MPCGGSLPKAVPGVGCRVSTTDAPAGSPAITIVPDPADQINGQAAGAAFDSTLTTATFQCTCTTNGQWTVTQVS